MPTLDVDILNPEAVQTIEDLVRDRYETDRGYVLTRVGKAQKRAIPFRTDQPFPKLAVNLIAPNGSPEKIEFLCDGQQVVVDGIHPGDSQAYRWFGGELGTIPRGELPYVDEEEAHRLVDVIVDMLIRDFSYQRAKQRPKAKRKGNGGSASETQGVSEGAGTDDWSFLCSNILTGTDLHDSITVLAAKMVASGINPGAAVNQLRSLMKNSSTPHDQRWHDRYDEIPRAVDSAVDKYKSDAGSQPQSEIPIRMSHSQRCTRIFADD